ncbi:MAG: cytochrome c [Rhodothermales bacterium]|nr:cytochrome c [Rhodothermales bacterium]
MKSSRYMNRYLLPALVVLTIGLGACRGTSSDKPPIHINPNMDRQERLDPQGESMFFADGRAMRLPVPGTVARGQLRTDARFYEGRDADGSFVASLPIPMTREVLERGRARYNIYCSPCHGDDGAGQGPVIAGNYGFVPPASYHIDRLRTSPDGYIYNVITAGFQTMPAYAQQITVADRWAIVSYVRALQRSQGALEGDIPASTLAEIQANANVNIN